MAENISIKYTIPKLEFLNPVQGVQEFSLYVKRADQEEFSLITDTYLTDSEGNNINEVIIPDLVGDTEYDLRIVHNLSSSELTRSFRTSISLTIGDSPLWMKKLYAGQTLDLFINGLLSTSLPTNYQGYLFILEQHYRDAYAGFANSEPQNGMGFKVGQNTVNSKKYSGVYMNGTRYVAMNNTHPHLPSRVNAAQMFDYDGSRAYSLWFWIYNEDGTGNTKPILTTGDSNDNYRIMMTGGVISITSTKAGVAETLTATSPITNNNWYLLEIRRNPNNPNYGVAFIHGDAGNIGFSPAFLFNSPNGQDSFTVYLGYDNLNQTVANGLLIRRLYFGTNPDLDSNNRNRLMYPDDYLPKLVFKRNSDNQEFINPLSWTLKLDDSVFSTSLDPTLPSGEFEMFVRTSTGETGNREVSIIPFTKDLVGFDIDFTDNFDSALQDFKDNFYVLHSQWGGQNGGVNGNLVYADREKKTLIFENHGDLYDGEVVGIKKPPQNSETRGYGVTKTHDIPADPEYGQDWKTRVGAVVVSKDYSGYGEWSTWMKVPEGTYGVAPALWFFHYQELYPTDERYQFWLDRGGKPYGGADPYMVINHEIDMELPSHLTMGVFAEWNQVSLAYFDPLALDDQYHIAVEDTSNPDNYGLFRLTNTEAPNSRSSWVKVSDTWDIVSTPKFSNCKFNNWVGEKSGGNGWAYVEEEYDGEEYLALLTKLDKTYADGEFHKWTIKWFKDRTELWVDDVYIRTNRAFVPYIPGRITLGGWFPSAVTGNTETPWKYSPERAWAGWPANFKVLHLEVNRISYTPYTNEEAGGANELFPETYPEAGIREIL